MLQYGNLYITIQLLIKMGIEMQQFKPIENWLNRAKIDYSKPMQSSFEEPLTDKQEYEKRLSGGDKPVRLWFRRFKTCPQRASMWRRFLHPENPGCIGKTYE